MMTCSFLTLAEVTSRIRASHKENCPGKKWTDGDKPFVKIVPVFNESLGVDEDKSNLGHERRD